MTKIFKPTNETSSSFFTSPSKVKVFLAGTIEMGNSEDWQSQVSDELSGFSDNLWVFNPRRIIHPESDDELKRQIEWELKHLYNSDIAFFHFAPNSVSPISLLELGLILSDFVSAKPMIISCNDEYTRFMNVKTTVESELFTRSGVKIYNTLPAAVSALKAQLDKLVSY
jgi:hypothetical protein